MKQAVILAGGKGTRLKNIISDIPKPMTPILGKPLLHYIIEQCIKYEIKNLCLLVSYKNEIIQEYFGDGKKFGVTIKYIVEDVPRGTAGALIDALSILEEQFLVLYGDTYFDIDFNTFWDFHDNHNGVASVFLHPNDHPYDSDLVEVDAFDQIQSIHPYPHDDSWRQNLVNAAVYIFQKNALKGFISKTKTTDIAKNLFPWMLQSKLKINGYRSTEYIKDMGTPERLSKLESDIKSEKVRRLRKDVPKIAIFIDRDGTINKEVNHLSNLEQLELIEGAAKAICKINETGILAIVVTNQPVVARGELDEDGLKLIHNKLETLLGREGAYIDKLYYCPHHPDSGYKGEIKSLKFNCECRKPNTELFKKAEREFNILLEKSWVIGDRTSDIMAAHNAGMKSVLVQTGFAGGDKKFDVEPSFVSKNLSEAVELVLGKINL